MSRRTLTLLLANLFAIVLTGAAVATPVPYVALGPGPTYNTLGDVDGTPVIDIEGTQVFPTDGHLDLTTVGVQPSLTLLEALRGWFDRDLAVVPRDVVYPPGKTSAEVNAENTASMVRSQSTATTAAARQLGIKTVRVEVGAVADGSPAAGRLAPGDVLVSVDGSPVTDEARLRALITEGGVGRVLPVRYERKGVAATTTITTAGSAEDASRPVIGITPVGVLPFTVDISLEEVGGPSAGLMFTLGILDKLGAGSLTGGTFIAGTGEITADGLVGPIGGIPQKLIAARAKGAVAFLVPEGNCAEAATRAPAGLALLKVATLAEALKGLEALRTGGSPVLCDA